MSTSRTGPILSLSISLAFQHMALMSLQAFDLTPTESILLFLTASPLIYLCYTVIYNLYFSPSSKFPGPKLWACSEFFYQRAIAKGVAHREMLKFFEHYGPVVRITPKELVFSSAQALRDIYATTHAQNGKKEVLGKDERL